MGTLALSLGVFATTFAFHWALWRVWMPRPATSVLLALFLGTVGPALMVGAWALGLITSAAELLHVGLFHVAASLAYIVIYAGLEVSSPSLAVARAVERAGAAGCAAEELRHAVTVADFVESRLALLERSGLMVEVDGVCRLTSRGTRVARFMVLVGDGVLRLPRGG